jgi:DedD protein
MVATWWVLTGTASPSFKAEDTQLEEVSTPEIRPGTQKQGLSPQPVPSPEEPEIIVAETNTAVTAPPPLTETLERQEPQVAVNRFTVQIGAFQQEEGARRRLDKLQEQGYEAHVISTEETGTPIFRVVTGDFRTRLEANLAANNLKAAGIDAFVREALAGPQ